jgi:hypothetical protein
MDTPDESAADKNSADKPAGEANALGGNAAANDLPNVDSPQLAGAGAGDEDVTEAVDDHPHIEVRSALPALFRPHIDHDEIDNEEAPEEPAPAATVQPRSFRFALLAASVAAAAGIGALFGALGASGLTHQHAAVAAVPRSGDTRDVVAALKAQLTEISALKASLDAAKNNTGAQFTRLSERLDSLERAQAEPAAKLAHLADEIDRLEKRTGAAPETTGSITSPPAAAPTQTASAAASILHDWVIQDVRNGRAMVESANGGFFLVGSGSVLPGLGHVQDIKRQNGEWIVVTDRGLITSHP